MPDTVPVTPTPAAAPATTPAAPVVADSPVTPAVAVVTPSSSTAPAAAEVAKPAAPEVVESLIGGETKPAADAPAEAAKPAEPTAYDLKLPDGVEVDAAQMEAAKAIFTKANIAPEAAQELATLHGEQMKALGQAMKNHQVEVWNTTIRTWQKEVAEDKTLGGANWLASKAAIEGGLQTVFGVTPTTPANAPERAAHKAFVGALAYTGAGSNLAILRGLHKMVARGSEGRPAPVGGPSAPKKSPAQVMYENSKQAAE